MAAPQEERGALDQGASAANALQGAMKAGKAIAGAAKGAAAGPYGAVAAAVVQNRHLLAKGCAITTFLLLLPLLFILLLPAIIFGSIVSIFDSTQPPVMNDNVAIVENITGIRDGLDGIVNEALDEVLREIDQDFLDSTGDVKHVENPCEATGVRGMVDSLEIICQYCASKNLDYTAISQGDLENMFRQAKDRFFSWTKREEIVLVPVEEEKEDGSSASASSEDAASSDSSSDSSSSEEEEDEEEEGPTMEEKHIYYTIVYNGAAYFADDIFHLTPEQKMLAAQYGENLHSFLGAAAGSAGGDTLAEIETLLRQFPYMGTGGSGGFQSPFPGLDWRGLVTSEYGSRIDPITNRPGEFHTGLDIAPGYGTEIRACKPGVVLYAKAGSTGYGNHIAIHHGDGLVTLYGHCSALLATAGTEVQAGDVIARVGDTGRVTGQHLHLEVILNGQRQDPRLYLP